MIKNKKKYVLTVTIENPNTEKGLVSLPIILTFDATLYLENHVQYLCLESERGGELLNIPLYKDGYELSAITRWACSYWNGQNGAYKLVSIALDRKEN